MNDFEQDDSSLPSGAPPQIQDADGIPQQVNAGPVAVPPAQGGALATQLAPTTAPQPAPATNPAGGDDTDDDNIPSDLPRFHRTVGNTLRGMLMGLAQGGIPGAIGGAASPQGVQRNADQNEQIRQTAINTQKAQFNFATAQAASMAADATMKAKALANYDDVYQRSVFKENQDTAKWFMDRGFTPTTVTANDGHSEMAAAKGLGTVPPLTSLQVAPGQILHFDLSQMPQQVGLDAVNQLNQQIGKTPIGSDAWGQTPQTARLQQIYNASQYWSPVASQDNVLQYKNDRARVAAIPDAQLPDKDATLAKYDGLISNMQNVLDTQHSKDEKQKISDFNAETPGVVHRAGAVAAADAAARAQFDNKPVYAVNGNGDTVLTTASAAQQGGMSAIRSVKEADITKDQHDIKVLSDIQVKANNVAQAAGAMDNKSWAQAGIAAKYLADNPNTPLNTLFKSSVMKDATPQTVNYAIAINSLRESSMGLQKVLTGSARSNETQLSALLNTLPGVEPNSGMVKQKLGAFTQNLELLSKGLPKGTGVELQGFGGGQQPQQQQPSQFVPQPGETVPTGTTMVVRDKAGNWHYSDGKNDLGLRGGQRPQNPPPQAKQPQAQVPQQNQPQSPSAFHNAATWVGEHSF